MLGHRGCRLGHHATPRSTRCRCGRSSRPPAQVCAEGGKAQPEIMIPLVGARGEFERLRARRRGGGQAGHRARPGQDIPYKIGTMIEIPRAALRGQPHRAQLRLLLLRHERPDADDLRLLARRHGHVPAGLHRRGDPPGGSLREPRPVRRGRARRDRRRGAAARSSPSSRSASAASTAAIRARSSSSTTSASTTSPARRTACRSRASRRRARRWPSRAWASRRRHDGARWSWPLSRCIAGQSAAAAGGPRPRLGEDLDGRPAQAPRPRRSPSRGGRIVAVGIERRDRRSCEGREDDGRRRKGPARRAGLHRLPHAHVDGRARSARAGPAQDEGPGRVHEHGRRLREEAAARASG